jgi:abortive infection alpha-like protein
VRYSRIQMPEPVSTAVGAAKALGAAKGAKDALDALDPAAEKFAEQITGSGRKELGAWFGDHVRLRRFKSQLKIIKQAQKMADEAGFDPQVVNLKLLVPLLESGSLEDEDDESMAERWAALLANAANPDAGAAVPPSFPDVLRQLGPTEAAILDLVFERWGDRPREEWASSGIVTSKAAEVLGIAPGTLAVAPPGTLAVAIDNLYRLRLCAPPGISLSFTDRPNDRFPVVNADMVCLTDFGHAFVLACRPPAGQTPQPADPVQPAQAGTPVATTVHPGTNIARLPGDVTLDPLGAPTPPKARY